MKVSQLHRNLLCVLFAMAASTTLQISVRGAAIVEGEQTDAQVTTTSASNTNYTQSVQVGNLFGTSQADLVEPFNLPYLAPGQKVVSASIQFYYEGPTGTPTFNGALYGLKRTSTTPTPLTSDFYEGSNDTANTLLNGKYITPSTTANQAVVYNGSNLTTFITNQYAAFSGANAFSPRYIFFRINQDASQVDGDTNYNIAAANNLTRNWHPELIITTSGGVTAVAGNLNFTFTLDNNYVTSAGVYNSQGILIRTLWNNKLYQSGTNTAAWNGLDDNGNTMAAGTYTIKMIYHNVQYVWEGTIGNTSDNQSGASVYRSFFPIASMSISGTRAYYAVSYNEEQSVFNYFNLSNPQVSVQAEVYANTLVDDPFSVFRYVVTDGTRAYWAKVQGGIGGTYTYVMATNNSDNTEYTFPKGNTISGQQWTSGVDLDTSAGQPNGATGLALQTNTNGNMLFVSHANLNVIRIFDKVQGSSIGNITITNPTCMACDTSGNLWVLCGPSTAPLLQKYSVSSTGKATLLLTVSSLVAPVGVGTSADGTMVLVTDGGTSQQVKAFNNSTGAALWTFGQLGGNPVTGPAVVPNSFDFTTLSYVAFQPDGTVWIGDPGNQRSVHYTISGTGASTTLTYMTQIAYTTAGYNSTNYSSTVDLTDPTRVFCGFQEYKVNYNVAPGGTNGSWTLVNNWVYGLPSTSTQSYTGFANGLFSVETFSNGRTYGMLTNYANTKIDLVELPASGPLRFTGYEYTDFPRMYADGSIRYNVATGTANQFYEQPLTGFDSAGNPHWGSPILLGSTSYVATDPVNNGQRVEVTSSGVIASFSPSKTNTGTHLGGIALNGTQWLWRESPSTLSSYIGAMPIDGRFDDGNGVQYAGNTHMSYGRNIIYGYHGELWKSSEASQWMNFFDDGLMVGQFGTLGLYVPDDQTTNGFAGNSFAPTLVTYNGNVYVYHNDESNHGGVVRWRINGLDQIKEISTTAPLGGTAALTTANVSQGPTVSITSPPNGETYVNSLNILIGATASSPNGSISSVQFFDGTTSIGTATAAPFNLTSTGLAPGTHSLTAKATDSTGVTFTSAPISVTVGSVDANTLPPTPTGLTATSVASNAIGLAWTQPTSQSGGNATGALVSFQFAPKGSSDILGPTAVAGAPGYAVGDFNALAPGVGTFVNPLDSTGKTVPNMEVDWDGAANTATYSTQLMTGTIFKLFYNLENTLSSQTAITVSYVPYALYDVVIYSTPDQILFGPQSSAVSVVSGFTTTTVTQNFGVQLSTYTPVTFAQGTNQTTSGKNTIIISGLSTPSFQIEGGAVAGFQVVERPLLSGVAKSYNVERQVGGSGKYSLVGTVTSGGTAFTDSTALPTTSYAYYVTATGSAGTSGNSNTLNVTTPSAGVSFASWQALYFTPSQILNTAFSGPTADPYGTGVSNLMAYALNLNPATSDVSDLPAPTLVNINGNTYLSLTYFQMTGATDIQYIVEVSSDLVNWNSGSQYVSVDSTVPVTGGQNVTVHDLTATTQAGKNFIRLRIQQN